MMNLNYAKCLLLISIFTALSCNRNMQTKQNADGTYAYETVPNDPMGAKIYTLSNGLKVYMSVNKDEPRIQTLIATRAGSKNDPADATGLAHYLEHMLFKGTSKIASLDWEKEKVLLQKIAQLYEKHRDAAEADRPAIYKEIDSLSGEAAQYVIANEYDKMVSSLGAKGTNAFTSLDRTVYVNDIPSNEIEKWMKLESERFNELVLRLFHTELEAVYEEYNISQGRDSRKTFAAFLKGLLPNHPYGTQTTIGTGEHLKTPSMEKIHAYFDKYYIPNNMAIILSGDFDPDEMVKLAEQYWGKYKAKRAPKWKQPAVTTVKEQYIEVFGREKANVQMGWRLDGANSDEALKAQLVGGILYNQKAGLIDINLIQKQEIGQGSAAGSWSANDYSFFYLYGEPREGQQIKTVNELLYKQLEKLKLGMFEDWMLDAVINNMELREIQALESNSGRAYRMLDAFIFDIDWKNFSDKYKRLRSFTKADIIQFAKDKLKKEESVTVAKLEGEDTNVKQVDKPTITPVTVNRTAVSDFRSGFNKMESPRQQPVFLDYKKAITGTKLGNGIELEYIKNDDNELFELVYVVDMGSNGDNVLPIALSYLKFLGTDKYSLQALQQEFFKLGLSFNVQTQQNVSFITLTGLERSLEKGVELLEHLLANLQPNEDALKKMVADIKKNRMDSKKDKRQILQRAMYSYAVHGHSSPFKARLRSNVLEGLQPMDLIKNFKKFLQHEHKIFYYGSKSIDVVKGILDKHHKVAPNLLPTKDTHFTQVDTDENKVVFVNYEGMVQAEVMLVAKGSTTFDEEEAIMARLYNEYFGAGLSSVVFQEIRESRALAYSAYAYSRTPSNKEKAHYFTAFVGTQSDKLKDAITALTEIIEEIPISESQLANSNNSILKKMETERVTGSDIYWNRRTNSKLGIAQDRREKAYKTYQELAKDKTAVVDALKQYHEKHIKGNQYTFLVLGDKSQLDMDYLKKLGKFEELTLKQVFGY